MADIKKKTEENSNRYTTDSESSQLMDMPSISQLLNRKKVNISKTLKDSATIPELTPIAKDTRESININQKNTEKSLSHGNFPKRQTPQTTEVPHLSHTKTHGQAKPKIAPPALKAVPNGQKTDEVSQKQNEDHAAQSSKREISISFDSPTSESLQLEQSTAPKTYTLDKTEIKEPSEVAIALAENKIPEPESKTDATPSVPVLKIAPSRRKSDQNAQAQQSKRALIRWDVHTLQKTRDPIGKGLLKFLEGGAQSVLFMSIQPPAPGSKYPKFTSTACFGNSRVAEAWAGLSWDPGLDAETWNLLVKKGSASFSPQTTPPLMSMAFGLSPQDYLTLLRVGPSQACRGLLVIISSVSVLQFVTQVNQIISVAMKKAA